MEHILVVGSSNTDLVVRTDRAPRAGETVVGEGFGIVPGGKGANQAVAAARLGAQVTFVARVGDDDFGRRNLENYRHEGIDTRYIAVDPREPSGVALIVVEASGENRIVVVPGANGRLSPSDVERAAPAFPHTRVLLVQLEVPLVAVETALQMAMGRGDLTILNQAPARALPREILSLVDFLTPNETELEVLAEGRVSGPEDASAAGERLLEEGPGTVIVTMGERGALIISGEGKREVPSFPVRAVVSTAAGDAFNGALALALARGMALAEAVRYACAAGALAVTKPGAQPSLPTAAEVEALLSGG
ncbi:MAG TPA: ribokinase [Candidatus Acetothermia bacterium]|nr:ribokinase [Candidatus Acetothermia bacterium]